MTIQPVDHGPRATSTGSANPPALFNPTASDPAASPVAPLSPNDSPLHYWMSARTRASRLVTLKGNNRSSFVGAFVAWLDGKWQTLVFESRHELKTAYIFLGMPGLEDLLDQPPAFTFVDYAGKQRHHTFDFLATIRGRRYAIACKFKSTAERLAFKSQLGWMKSQLNGFADEILFVKEEAFTPERALQAELCHFINREADDEADAAVLAVVRGMVGSITIAAIVQSTGLKARAFRSIVRLVAQHRLIVADKGRIDDYETHVAWVVQS